MGYTPLPIDVSIKHLILQNAQILKALKTYKDGKSSKSLLHSFLTDKISSKDRLHYYHFLIIIGCITITFLFFVYRYYQGRSHNFTSMKASSDRNLSRFHLVTILFRIFSGGSNNGKIL